jgi:predicted DNA-binding protein YlxM (UPF0122 family)
MNWNDIPTIKDRVPHHTAKLTHDQVRYIREQIKQGVKLDALAYEFDVSRTVISNIKHGYNYRRVL